MRYDDYQDPSGTEPEMTSLPASVRRMAELAHTSPAQEARLAMGQFMAELARSHGDLACLVTCAQMGASGFSRTRVEERRYVDRRETRLLGICVGTAYVPTSEVRTVTETLRLLP